MCWRFARNTFKTKTKLTNKRAWTRAIWGEKNSLRLSLRVLHILLRYGENHAQYSASAIFFRQFFRFFFYSFVFGFFTGDGTISEGTRYKREFSTNRAWTHYDILQKFLQNLRFRWKAHTHTVRTIMFHNCGTMTYNNYNLTNLMLLNANFFHPRWGCYDLTLNLNCTR